VPRARKPSRPFAASSPRADLLRHAVGALFADDSAGRRFLGPLCFVAPGGRAGLLDDLASRAEASGWEVLRRDGETLGREIATAWDDDTWNRLRGRFTRARLVVVDRLEAVGEGSRQAAVSQLFDATPKAVWCVAVEAHPLAGTLAEPLAARIATGFVITISPATAGRPAADAPRLRPPSIARIVSVTARHFGLDPALILGPGRSRSLARARSLAMYLARLLTGRSFAVIGRAFAGRDHTTVMHGTRIAAARLADERGFAADAEVILERLTRDRDGGRLAAGTMSIP
jgi:chromosomal replication initiation ATPase DnaA